MNSARVLTLNGGSSSLKFSVYEIGVEEKKCVLSGKFDRDGNGQTRLQARTEKAVLADEVLSGVSDLKNAVEILLNRFPAWGIEEIKAIGHRIVQGGPHHTGPEKVTPALMNELRSLCPLDPPHLSASLEALAATQAWNKEIPQVACFDTAFHRSMPEVAQALPLPYALTEKTGLLRYGFHGLSYEYIVSELKRRDIPEIAQGRVIVAHLGNGASMAAIRDGKCIDTTMGFTPAGGLMMSSRTGDLDPGVIAYLLREGKVSPENLSGFVFQECGLKGVSGLSSDLRQLMECRQKNARAQRAIDLFCYQARKALGSLIAALDGLDLIVFTGGIGENMALIREEICAGARHLRLVLDPQCNSEDLPIISSSRSHIMARVMKTNEEVVIARHAARVAFPELTKSEQNPL